MAKSRRGYVWWSILPNSSALGGISRSKNAIRDEHGRFMPNDEVSFEQWKLDPEHGKKGGRANARTCKRARGFFAAKDGT